MLALWRRPSVRSGAIALILIVSTLLLSGGAYFGDPAELKQLAVFGDESSLRRALLTWWLFGSLLVAALLLAHRRPLLALLLAGIGGIGHQLDTRFSVQPLDLAVPVVLFIVAAAARSRWTAGIALAVMAAAEFLVSLRTKLVPNGKVAASIELMPVASEPLVAAAGHSFQVIVVLGLAAAVGDGMRSHRRAVAVLEQRAADLERDQQQRRALAIAAERARISRELHDIVGHGLSVIVAQAQGAAAALHKHPERTAVALRHVIDTGRDALAESRRLLGVLGNDSTVPAVQGIAALPHLVERVRTTGLRVRLRIDGDPRPLPAGVDLSVHRIVQEALTNTLKHAGPGTDAEVALRFTPGALEVDVRDGGPAVPSPGLTDSPDLTDSNGSAGSTHATGSVHAAGSNGSAGAAPGLGGAGYGLRGIAERVDQLGGELAFGPAGDGGFHVHARMPIGASR